MVNCDVNRQPVGRAPRVLILAMLFALAVAVGGFTAAAQTFASYGGSVVDQTGNVVTEVPEILRLRRGIRPSRGVFDAMVSDADRNAPGTLAAR